MTAAIKKIAITKTLFPDFMGTLLPIIELFCVVGVSDFHYEEIRKEGAKCPLPPAI
jgi:hypothetical protein